MSVCVVFAPSRERHGDGDGGALRVTRWIADRSVEHLAADGVSPEQLLDGDATRGALERALGGTVDGAVLLGHGSASRLVGDDGEPALDPANVSLLRDRWGHVFACSAGRELVHAAATAGARCFVGYDVSLIMEFEPADLPAALRPLVADLATSTTRALAAGVADARELKRRASAMADAVVTWCDAHPGVAPGAEILASQLVERLVVGCPYPDEA